MDQVERTFRRLWAFSAPVELPKLGEDAKERRAESVQVGPEPDQTSQNASMAYWFWIGSGGSLAAGCAGTKTIPSLVHGRGLGDRASPGKYLGHERKVLVASGSWVGARVYRKPERGPNPTNIGCQAVAFLGLGATPKAERPAGPAALRSKAGWAVGEG